MADNTDGSAQLHNSHIHGVVVGTNLGTIIYGRPPEEAERQRLVAYLEQVTKSHNTLRVVGVGSSHLTSGIDLASAYMMLSVQGMYRVFNAEDREAYTKHQFRLDDYYQLPDWMMPNLDNDTGVVVVNGLSDSPLIYQYVTISRLNAKIITGSLIGYAWGAIQPIRPR
ncbi:hypothetical protein JOD20_005322, partial [Herpetosiphon giganteus]|nr:hypothetical protein [Herpetosiphon giganteus]